MKPSALQRGCPTQCRSCVGTAVGLTVGETLGLCDGLTLGLALGDRDGLVLGDALGLTEGTDHHLSSVSGISARCYPSGPSLLFKACYSVE